MEQSEIKLGNTKLIIVSPPTMTEIDLEQKMSQVRKAAWSIIGELSENNNTTPSES